MKPTCHENHLPPYLQKHDEFKKLGVDVIAVLSFNDAFVMSGWGRFIGLTDKVEINILAKITGYSLYTSDSVPFGH